VCFTRDRPALTDAYGDTMTAAQIAHGTIGNSVPGRSGDATPQVAWQGNTKYRDLDVIEALQEVYTRVGGAGSRGLTYNRYGDLKRVGQPCEAQIVNRVGSWADACELAGIPCGGKRRPKDSYSSKWTDDDLMRIVRRFLHHAEARGVKPTYGRYETYRRTQADSPSGTMLRHRMASLGLTSWAATLAGSRSHVLGL